MREATGRVPKRFNLAASEDDGEEEAGGEDGEEGFEPALNKTQRKRQRRKARELSETLAAGSGVGEPGASGARSEETGGEPRAHEAPQPFCLPPVPRRLLVARRQRCGK